MNEIEKLIQELCPDGVEYRRLGECLDYEQPGKYIVTSKDYIESGIPVLTAGQTFILGYTDEINGIYQANKENPVIIFDDFTTSFHWVTFDFKVKSSAMKMLKPKTNNVVFRYVYHVMKCIKYETLEHSRQWISKYSNIEIPLPPLSIQEKIVEILDKFTSLEAELEAELEARRKQYEYYREKLLNTNNKEGIIWLKLGDICSRIKDGSHYSPKSVKQGYYMPSVKDMTSNGFDYSSCKMISEEDYHSLVKAGCHPVVGDVLIAKDGSMLKNVFPINKEDDIVVLSSIAIITPIAELVNGSYLSHYLRSESVKERTIRDFSSKGGVPRIILKNFKRIPIPLPPLSEQRRIVEILDRFEALTNDLQAGLPAEIAARRQQYEYYREKLLTFKRKTV